MLRVAAILLPLAVGFLAPPLAADAQQVGKVYRVGFLTPTFDEFILSMRVPSALSELDYIEGKNIRFEYRAAGGRDEQLPELAAELVALKVDVIVTAGVPAIRAAKKATTTVPIVMAVEGDPVKAGLVASLARPGGNVTGVTTIAPELSKKRLQLVKEAVPGLTRVAVLWNPANPEKAEEWKEVQAAARVLGVQLQSLEVRRPDDFEPAFQAAVRERAGALLVMSDSSIWSQAKRISLLAAKSRLPAMYPSSFFVDFSDHNGLMSYAASRFDFPRDVAAYVDRILKGAKPADLPVAEPTRIELVINLKAAKAIGLTIPQSVLLRADKVIPP